MSEHTSTNVRLACKGDKEALIWIVQRFSPLLMRRAGGIWHGRPATERSPEDAVAETWLIALPYLPRLEPRDGRMTPVLLQFLYTVLTRRLKKTQEAPVSVTEPPERSDGKTSHEALRALVQSEEVSRVYAAIEALGYPDCDIVLARAMDEETPSELGERLGLSANAVNIRNHRAVKKLRDDLGPSIFDDL